MLCLHVCHVSCSIVWGNYNMYFSMLLLFIFRKFVRMNPNSHNPACGQYFLLKLTPLSSTLKDYPPMLNLETQ